MRHARIVALLVLIATPALAQEPATRTTLLTLARRQGTAESGSVVLPTGASQIVIEVPIATADYEDDTNTLSFTVYYFVPTTQEWKSHGRNYWRGGPYVDRHGEVNPPPREFLDSVQWGGVEIRVEIDHLQTMRAGVDLVTR